MPKLTTTELLLPNPSECDEEYFLKAALKRARELWQQRNPSKVRRPGQPSMKNLVWAAGERVRSAHPRTATLTLGRWIQLVTEDLSSRAKKPSRDTVHQHLREWMIHTLPIDALPIGIGSYLLTRSTKSKDFADACQVLIWSRLITEFSSVHVWVKSYQDKHGALPPGVLSDSPQDILPKELLDQVEARYGRLRPALISQWISTALQAVKTPSPKTL
ncbi:MAG: hypothetical protein Q8L77_14615 [Nitrospirota bacterium]|nr:hypothetical protein [Nitrospirota bacterium]